MNEPTDTPTPRELRASGLKVKIEHRRYYKIAYVDPKTNKIVIKTIFDGDPVNEPPTFFSELNPKGGKTEVTVIDPVSKMEFFAYSICRNDENYNKSIGVQKSLDRITDLVQVCAVNNESELTPFSVFLKK